MQWPMYIPWWQLPFSIDKLGLESGNPPLLELCDGLVELSVVVVLGRVE